MSDEDEDWEHGSNLSMQGSNEEDSDDDDDDDWELHSTPSSLEVEAESVNSANSADENESPSQPPAESLEDDLVNSDDSDHTVYTTGSNSPPALEEYEGEYEVASDDDEEAEILNEERNNLLYDFYLGLDDESSGDVQIVNEDDNDNDDNSSEDADGNGSDTVNNDGDDGVQAENEDEQEAGEPPRKQLKLDTSPTPSTSRANKSLDDDSDGFTCTICYEPFTNSGEHRISCLKCGHVFGKNCIDRWLNQKHSRCPQCNCKAVKKDVRILFVKSLKAVDTTELTEAKNELARVQDTNAKYTLEVAKMKITIESLQQQIKRIETLQKSAKINESLLTDSLPGPSTATPTTPKKGPPGRKSMKFAFSKFFDVKEGICRVGAYNEWLNMLIVSHEMKSSLYPNGCCGIKEINMFEMRPSVSLPIHQKQIRDMQFSLCQNDILLTVAMDKKALLFNCNGNVTVQTFQTEFPLWACTWDEVQQYIFYAGTSNGQIISYDIRSPQEPLATFSIPSQDRSPICRLRFVRPAYQSNAFNLSGLLVQKLNSVNFCEFRGGRINEQRFHQLPLEGPFVNIDFEPVSRHMLVSTRPSLRQLDMNHNYSTHLLCDLTQYYSETLERNVVSTNLIRTYQGGTREVQKMCRPIIFSPEAGYVYVCANGSSNAVKLWDVSVQESEHGYIGPAPEFTLDFVRGKVNNADFLGLVSEKGVRIFKQTFI